MKQQCIQAVAQALGKSTLNQQEIKNIEQRVIEAKKNIARKDRTRWHNLSDSEKLKEAAAQVALDIQAQLQRKKQIVVDDVLKQNKNIAALDHPTLPASEVVDRMIAAHGDMSGVQSIATKAKAIANIYRGELTEFYTNVKGGLGVFVDQNLVRNIVQERFGKSSGDTLAKQISDKMGEVFENMRDRFNRNGGDIGKLDDWGIPQSHNAEKLAVAGKQQWVNDATQTIDRNKYVNEDGSLYTDAQLKELLEYSFDSIVSDGANKTEVGKSSHQGTSKVTNKHSESRVLHFKDADAWMEYQSKYGGAQFVDLIEAHIATMSRDIALVESLGSNPKMSMKILMDAAKKKDWEKGISTKDTNSSIARSQIMFDELVGGNTPQSQVLANLGLAYRSMNVASMLGGTTITSFTDQAMIARTASVHGISYWKTFGELVTQLNPKNRADRDLARSLGLATEEMLGSINRWADDGLTSVHGKSEKYARVSNSIAAQVLRISGLNALTAASKTGFSKILMSKYGEMTRTKAWKDLDAHDKELMEGTGINERAWEVMRLAEPVIDRKGNQLMSARSIYAIPDDKLLAAMDADTKALMNNIQSQIKTLNDANLIDDQRIANKAQRTDDIKRQLSQRLLDYANRKDSKAQAEKQALQDRIDLIDAQKEYAAAQADMNTHIRNMNSKDDLKSFIDDITQGRTIDNIAANVEKLGRNLEALDNKVAAQAKNLNEKIKTFEKDIQNKFKDFTELLDGKAKLSKEKLSIYEDKLSERLNRYASRRDVITAKQVDALNSLKEIISLKQDRLKTEFEIKKATTQTKIKQKTDQKIDDSLDRNTRRDYKSGENIGRRLGSAERRITEMRANMRKTDNEANKAINQKFNELDKKVMQLDDEFSQYQTKVDERQQRRNHVIDRINNSVDERKKDLAKKIRDEVATQFQTHILDEQGMAVIEAGLRERTWLLGNTKRGSVVGELWRSITQFKSFPTAFLMRHGSRTFAQKGLKGKASYGMSLFFMTTMLGALVVQLKELANGNDPQVMFDSDDPQKTAAFFGRSVVQGGGLSVLGDIVVAGADPAGRSIGDFMTGPFGKDVESLAGLTVGNAMQWYKGKDTNAANEAFKLAKGKMPAQNLWYTKAAVNRMFFDEIQDSIAPGYREKLLRKAEREQGRTQWWGDDINDFQAPDFERVVK